MSRETSESGSDRGSMNFGALEEAWHQLGDRPMIGIGAEEKPSVVEVMSSDERSEGEQTEGGDQGAEVGQHEAGAAAEEEAEDPDFAWIDLDGVPVRVSVARSVGGASCSYWRGLPMHPYYYEEGEWSADTVPTRMTHELLERIRREYSVPRDVVFALPQADNRPSRPPQGWVTLY
ncbi:unnamed protein product [Prunus armeniaca]